MVGKVESSGPVLLAALALLSLPAAAPVRGRVDLLWDSWLILGPFAHDRGCGGSDAELLRAAREAIAPPAPPV